MADNVVDILKKIREGFLDPKEISVSDRRICVAYLRLEGYTQEEIAQIFKVHRQTIIRDEKANRKEAREKFPIDWDKEFASFDWLLDKIDEATDWNIVKTNGLEADDWMAVGSRFFKDNEVILITYDCDLEQCWNYKNVKIFSPIKKCAGKTGKGAYKIPPPNFNVYP